MKKSIIASFFIIISFACRKEYLPNTGPHGDDTVVPVVLDCVPGAPNVEEIIASGDPYATTPPGYIDFYGYADPSMRKDPDQDALWLAYSWPHYKLINSNYIPSVEIHLAKSTNAGDNWTFVKTLWEPDPMANPADPGQQGHLDHETANLLPVKDGGTTIWYGARLNYFLPDAGGFAQRPSNSFHVTILKASDPENLSTGEIGKIGATLTHANWNATILVPNELASDSFFWNEPALYYENGTLYLVMAAFVYAGNTPIIEKQNIYVFSTTPTGAPQSWNWTYNGKLADASIANELGAEKLTQIDLAKGVDGKLLLIATPDDWNSAENDYNHKGCKVLEIKSLENPELERDKQGNLKVRAIIAASDANSLGSAASTYDPNSNTGILFTRRVKTAAELTVSIWKTSVKP